MPKSITGADIVARKLAANLQPAIEAGMLAVLEEGQAIVASYPSPSGRKQPPKTAKQRRFLFALARAGGIPYRRSGDLGKSWQPRKLGPLRMALVNTQRYAQLVHGKPGEQAGYHAGTWKNITETAAAVRPRVKPLMIPPIVNALKGNT